MILKEPSILTHTFDSLLCGRDTLGSLAERLPPELPAVNAVIARGNWL